MTDNQVSSSPGIKYAGFWERVAARVCDLLLLIVVSYPVHLAIGGFWLNLFNT